VLSNYPIPFNPSTTIEFSLPERSRATLSVFTITGQKVSDLFSGVLPPGNHRIRWNGTDASGNRLSSGVYLFQLDDGKRAVVRKVLLMK
jgi:flagellar hook assembly protein FlgD